MRYLDCRPCRETVQEAVAALQAGIDLPALRILAGLPENEPRLSAWEVEAYVKRSVEELGHVAPGRDECLRQYVRDVGQAITTGELPAGEGCQALATVWLRAPDLQLPGWIIGLNEDLSLARDGVAGSERAVEEEIVKRARTLAEDFGALLPEA